MQSHATLTSVQMYDRWQTVCLSEPRKRRASLVAHEARHWLGLGACSKKRAGSEKYLQPGVSFQDVAGVEAACQEWCRFDVLLQPVPVVVVAVAGPPSRDMCSFGRPSTLPADAVQFPAQLQLPGCSLAGGKGARLPLLTGPPACWGDALGVRNHET